MSRRDARRFEFREDALTMNEKSAPEESASNKEVQEKSGAPYIEVSGSQSTRELRDTSRRRREAEEKLQQHLLEAKEHAHDAEQQAQGQEHAPAKESGGDPSDPQAAP
jgi:hypothetical protein